MANVRVQCNPGATHTARMNTDKVTTSIKEKGRAIKQISMQQSKITVERYRYSALTSVFRATKMT